MNPVLEYIENLNKLEYFDALQAKRVENLYDVNLIPLCKSIVCHLKDAIFFESKSFIKLLSFQEIIDAQEDMQLDFKRHRLVPIFDVGDNDFICFNAESCGWSLFNIVDEIIYEDSNQLSIFLEKFTC